MSRHRVPQVKRQRTALACDLCKRRKQKCTGGTQCSTCAKKSVSCTYLVSSTTRPSPPARRRHARPAASPRMISTSTRGAMAAASAAASAAAAAAAAATTSATEAASEQSAATKRERGIKPRSWSRSKKNAPFELETAFLHSSHSSHGSHSSQAQHHHLRPLPLLAALPGTAAHSDQALEDHTMSSSVGVQDEEAVLEQTTRLLKDQTGRLLYIGDSATLSYLHLLRRIVESISGPSDFTTDPSKDSMVETLVDLPSHIRPPSMLPDHDTASVLVESFFTNTSGLVEIFGRDDFLGSLDTCYGNPLSASNRFLCLLFLTFAIGLVMATPGPGTKESAIIRRLDDQPFDQAELFFLSAKCLCDPLAGLENADLWSTQALTLISIYMLAVSRHNAAFAYHGMAVRSAVALGLHRKEAMANFGGPELSAHRNIWASLYVLDRFMAASLGRPSAINEDECSEITLEDAGVPSSTATETHVLGVKATVRSCRITGVVLKKLYAQRRVSTRDTRDIVQQCSIWTSDLPARLRWHSRSSPSLLGGPPRAESIAILHANLVFCHSIILLTRPFFLFLIRSSRHGAGRDTPPLRTRTDKFSEVCVTASYHTITMIRHAFVSAFLPRRNPFVIYFLFTAALVIMSNEFVALFHHPAYNTYATQAISIMAYFAKTDVQATRLLWTLKALHKAVAAHAKHDILPGGVARPDGMARPFRFEYPPYFIDGSHDPIAFFFAKSTVKSSWCLSASEPRTAKTASGQLSSSSSASDELGAAHLQPSSTPPQSTAADQAGPYSQSRHPVSSFGDMLSAGDTAESGLPPRLPAQPHSLSYSPGHGNRGHGGGSYDSEGSAVGAAGVSFGGGYVGPSGFGDAMGACTAGDVAGYFHHVPESKYGHADASDSVGTDTDGFDLDVLWNWPCNANTALAGADAVSIAASSATVVWPTPPTVAAGGEGGTVEHGSHAGSSSSRQQGPLPSSPPPAMYEPYSISMHLSATSSGVATPHGGPLMAAPMNVPLYAAADTG